MGRRNVEIVESSTVEGVMISSLEIKIKGVIYFSFIFNTYFYYNQKRLKVFKINVKEWYESYFHSLFSSAKCQILKYKVQSFFKFYNIETGVDEGKTLNTNSEPTVGKRNISKEDKTIQIVSFVQIPILLAIIIILYLLWRRYRQRNGGGSIKENKLVDDGSFFMDQSSAQRI